MSIVRTLENKTQRKCVHLHHLAGLLLCFFVFAFACSQSSAQEIAVDIRDLQEALASAGFHPGPIDGAIGPRTRSALREFQRANDLPATGRQDYRSLLKLGLGQIRNPRPTQQSEESSRIVGPDPPPTTRTESVDPEVPSPPVKERVETSQPGPTISRDGFSFFDQTAARGNRKSIVVPTPTLLDAVASESERVVPSPVDPGQENVDVAKANEEKPGSEPLGNLERPPYSPAATKINTPKSTDAPGDPNIRGSPTGQRSTPVPKMIDGIIEFASDAVNQFIADGVVQSFADDAIATIVGLDPIWWRAGILGALVLAATGFFGLLGNLMVSALLTGLLALAHAVWIDTFSVSWYWTFLVCAAAVSVLPFFFGFLFKRPVALIFFLGVIGTPTFFASVGLFSSPWFIALADGFIISHLLPIAVLRVLASPSLVNAPSTTTPTLTKTPFPPEYESVYKSNSPNQSASSPIQSR